MVAVSSKANVERDPTHQHNNSKDGHWVRGRTAMAAVPNQGNGVAVECMNLKGGRTAMAAFPDQVGDWQGRRMWYFFFWAVPCALEAQTVINTSCFDWRFPRKREKVRQ